MNVHAQEQALLELIAGDRDARCEEILGGARQQAAELLRRAHAEARERVRKALREARERAGERVAAAIARRQTRERLAQQGSASDFLAQALELLPAALQARWQQPPARLGWVRQALLQAQRLLPAGDWRIDHAPGLEAADIAQLAAAELPPSPPHFQPDPELLAGLRIHGNGNCIDASLAGLLADRDSLAARLLGARERPT